MDDRQFFLEVAEACARQSTCLRRHYGAVIVNPTDRTIISTGYNGSPRGKPHCTDSGTCIRQKLNIPMGEQYQWCCSNHGEMNAIIQSKQSVKDCVLYLYGWDVELNRSIIPKPCFMCTKLMLNSGIYKVYTGQNVIDINDLYDSYISELHHMASD